ncbi:unnamed protein product [Lactuca saligna]|uniref:Zinc finger PMZ-type domain-containing protein n=1 Tax=Lactuca saligna TaxID=75948 RepID=A0AA36A3J5_LACSI|nr:unnamed protein product [Lactuca saligna]
MVGWRIRANMAEIDVGRVYSGNPLIFSIKLFYNGVFTKFPGRRYIKGKVKYVDLVDIVEFSVHDIDEMMDILGYVEEEWKTSTTGDCSGSTIPEVEQCGKPPNEPQFQTQGFDQDFDHCENPPNDFDQDFTSFVQEFDQGVTAFVQDEVNQNEDNMIEEPDIDMKEFFLNIDQNTEWMGDNGGSSMKVEDGKEDEEIKSFGSSEELKNKIKQHVVETRIEIVIIKNDKNRVRAVCKGSIPNLIEVGVGGPVEERKCPWVLYASKWSKDADWEVESNPTIPTRALQEQLQRQYQCDISKTKVFQEKNEANIHVRGSLKKGFVAGKQDYVGLDGSFMNGPYPRIVLTAVGLDGNNCTYPLAYAVVEAENINSWTWFLNCLGDDPDLHSNSNFTFISDRHKGLLHAVGTLFPSAEHRFCLRHIHENMKKQWRGRVFQDMLWNCATHWARSHFIGRAHCDGLLNNLCESLNSQLQKSREQPIITCLEFIREYLMVRIVTVQKVVDKAFGPLTPTATTVLEKMRKWELTGIPCKHALVAIWDMRKNNKDVGLPESWVHPIYWLKTWKEMYSFKIKPINGRRMWEKYPFPTTLLPPKHHVPIGRPKKK